MTEPNSSDKKPKESYSEKDQWNDDLDLPPLQHKKATAKKPILEKADFDKKKKQPWKLIFASLFIFVGLAVFFIFNSKNEVSKTVKTAKNTEEKQRIEDENVSELNQEKTNNNTETVWLEDTVVVEELEELEPEQNIIGTNLGPHNYHIVIGSFLKEENALLWQEQLGESNATPIIIEYQKMFRVVLSSHGNADEAEIELDRTRTIKNFKAWIAYMN